MFYNRYGRWNDEKCYHWKEPLCEKWFHLGQSHHFQHIVSTRFEDGCKIRSIFFDIWVLLLRLKCTNSWKLSENVFWNRAGYFTGLAVNKMSAYYICLPFSPSPLEVKNSFTRFHIFVGINEVLVYKEHSTKCSTFFSELIRACWDHEVWIDTTDKSRITCLLTEGKITLLHASCICLRSWSSEERIIPIALLQLSIYHRPSNLS